MKLSLLLRPEARTPQGVAAAAAALSALGARVTASGAASVSADIDEATFRTVFGRDATPVAPRARGARDFGAPGGFTVDGELAVPETLRDWVESIDVPGPATRHG